MDLQDKVVLITGGAQGIGLALAEELRSKGARLALLDVNPDTLASATSQWPTDQVLTVAVDVRDRDAMDAAVTRAVEHFGRLDVVVANAGVTPPPATLRHIDLDEFDRVIDINLTGVLNTVRPAIEPIIATGGHITVVASAAAFSPGLGGAAYMVSKAGAEQLGRALRLELAPHGVSVGVAYFGLVDTPLAHATLDDHPLGPRIEAMLPKVMSKRVTPLRAAQVLTDGIVRRRPRTMAPGVWLPYSMLRGLANVAVDFTLVRDKKVHQLVADIEQLQAAKP